MLSNKELYGTEDVPLIPRKVADKRIELLRSRLKDLMASGRLTKDTYTINKILEGITFWTNLKEGESMESIIEEEVLMSYSVNKNEKGVYVLTVKAHGNSVNEWDLGTNEEIAQSKTTTIVSSYTKGMEFVQSQVRDIFEKEGN